MYRACFALLVLGLSAFLQGCTENKTIAEQAAAEPDKEIQRVESLDGEDDPGRSDAEAYDRPPRTRSTTAVSTSLGAGSTSVEPMTSDIDDPVMTDERKEEIAAFIGDDTSAAEAKMAKDAEAGETKTAESSTQETSSTSKATAATRPIAKKSTTSSTTTSSTTTTDPTRVSDAAKEVGTELGSNHSLTTAEKAEKLAQASSSITEDADLKVGLDMAYKKEKEAAQDLVVQPKPAVLLELSQKTQRMPSKGRKMSRWLHELLPDSGK